MLFGLSEYFYAKNIFKNVIISIKIKIQSIIKFSSFLLLDKYDEATMCILFHKFYYFFSDF